MNLNLCKVCAKDLKRNGDESDVQNPWQCCLCFGIVDSDFVDGVVAEVRSLRLNPLLRLRSFLLNVLRDFRSDLRGVKNAPRKRLIFFLSVLFREELIDFQVSKEFDKARYDSNSFVLALNLPITTILRNAIFDLNYRSECPSSSPSLKIRVVDSYLNKIKKVCGF